MPSAVDHPNTLFTLLGRTHRLDVAEALTSLCPRRLCPPDTETSLAGRLAAMARDLRVVFLHLVLTEDLTEGLPDPTATWARLAEGNEPSARESTQGVRERWRQGITAERVTPNLQFIERLDGDEPQPTFYFLHTLVTHHPYYMQPTGRQNGTSVSVPGKVAGGGPSAPLSASPSSVSLSSRCIAMMPASKVPTVSRRSAAPVRPWPSRPPVAPLLTASFAALLYARAVANGFSLDDKIDILENRFVTGRLDLVGIFSSDYYGGWGYMATGHYRRS